MTSQDLASLNIVKVKATRLVRLEVFFPGTLALFIRLEVAAQNIKFT